MFYVAFSTVQNSPCGNLLGPLFLGACPHERSCRRGQAGEGEGQACVGPGSFYRLYSVKEEV